MTSRSSTATTGRLVVVLAFSRGPTVENAVLFSLAAHLAFAVAAVTLPSLRGRPSPPLPTLDVVLVSPLAAATPGPPAAVPPAPAPPQPEPEPPPEPAGPSVTPELPPEKPVEKPVEKPKPKKPEPVKPPEPDKRPAPTPGDDASDAAAPAAPAGQAAAAPRGPIGAAAGGALAGMGAEFDWYRDAVIRALDAAWRQPFAAHLRQPLEVTIAFEIHRDGSVGGVRIAETSGNDTLDRSAFRAVLEAQLPPLPRNHGRSSQPALFVFHLDPRTP